MEFRRLIIETSLFCLALNIISSCHGFIMIEFNFMCPKNILLQLIVHTDAEIDIIISNRKRLVEPANSLKIFGLHHATRSSDSIVIDIFNQSAEISDIATRETNLDMSRSSTKTEHYSCMLNCFSRIIKLRTHNSDTFQLSKRDHSSHPRTTYHFCIIIQKQQILSIGFLRR